MTTSNARPSSYPTTSDISMLMKELGYDWSNEGQIYYGSNYQHISNKSAEYIYQKLIGDKPYTPVRERDLEKQVDELAKFIMKEFGSLMIGEGAIEMAIRLLNEYKYRDGVVGKDPNGKEIKN